uniref:Uncharacterized protein n=1 Tax=Panagrolaimus davidi TaxID=227884 RepID=A0A914Q1H7_9BILA
MGAEGLASIPCQILPRYIFKGYFFALIYFTVFIEIFVGIVCILLFRININFYNNQVFPELTARYQTMENIKNLKQILIFVLFGLIHNIIIVIFAILIFILWQPSGNFENIANLNAFWNLANSIFAVFYPLIFITDSNKFKSVFRPCRKSQKISPYLEQQPFVIRSATGKVITQNSDQDEHFRELKRLWDSI